VPNSTAFGLKEFSEPNVPSQVNTEEIEEIDGEQFATGATNKKGFSHRGKAFLPQEDRVIVSGWLNISTDACMHRYLLPHRVIVIFIEY
jgi:hypothetical protein